MSAYLAYVVEFWGNSIHIIQYRNCNVNRDNAKTLLDYGKILYMTKSP